MLMSSPGVRAHYRVTCAGAFMKARLTFLAILAACAFSMPAFCDELSPQKQADIERLLEMTGTMTLGQQMGVAFISQMTDVLRQAHPEIPQRLLDGLAKEINAVIEANLQGYKSLVVQLYHQHFTDDEIKELISFYATPIGQKLVAVTPQLIAESAEAGQKWGQSLRPQIEERVRALFKQQGYQI